ncbi:transglutaminase-like domain-containing protein [Robertkochia solimangrovi]|uniref:transglutaminase-like domain-containing protein n=1 Tax=Robertkochia solimangrovi TaxID=2213046 RepID=UPI00117E6893|nr:transglutaminase-like domain-containing protein [Robertkochia solimangrovi]TRZ42247.1 transglutaminase [Robertkochia solimangrovi]
MKVAEILPPKTEEYLKETRILNYTHPSIQLLIKEQGWDSLMPEQKIKGIYEFVRDDIKFGYNEDDRLSASEILQDGYGQCNTKATLFMALLRALGIPNRIHGFTIKKALQKGAITGLWYLLSPDHILHSWVEVYLDKEWFELEGLILDKPYLKALQNKFPECKTEFCGYGAFTDNLRDPEIEWNRNNTYIQKKGIDEDFGLFDTPDEFYTLHQQNISLFKRWLFKNYVRHLMNRNVNAIREK